MSQESGNPTVVLVFYEMNAGKSKNTLTGDPPWDYVMKELEKL